MVLSLSGVNSRDDSFESGYEAMTHIKQVIKKSILWIVPHKFLNTMLQLPLVIKLRHDPFFTKAYYCKALTGDSDYNICINSDMTVSCNCWDDDGSGHIGDLNHQTLEQIFHGKVAQSFRKKLAKGWLPIDACARCLELQRINKRDAGHYLTNYHVPQRGLMVENTALCNLKCTICPRDKIMKTRKKMSMSLEDMEKVAKTVRDYQTKTIFFHNLGEPFFSKTVFDEISIIRKYNPQVRVYTSTNGLLLNSTRKREAALMMDHIFFSIDGSSQELVTKYQVGGDFEKSYRNMKELVDFRNSRNELVPVVEWKYVVFSWNDGEDAIERAIELAKEAHVDIISFWRGDGSTSAVSQRFLHHPYFQRLGEKSTKGRKIDFREYSYSQSFKTYKGLGGKGDFANTLYQSGMILEEQGKYKEAIEKYMQSLKALDDLKDIQCIAGVYGQIGKSYESDGYYKNAMKNYILAIKFFESVRSPYTDLATKDLLSIRNKIDEETFNLYLTEMIEEPKVKG